MVSPEERRLIKDACERAFQDEMGHVFRVLFGAHVNEPATEPEALNRARLGMTAGLKTLQACVRLADELT